MADDASTTRSGRACLRRGGGERSPLTLRHEGRGLTLGVRRRVTERAGSLRGLIVGMSLAVIAWIAAAVVLFAGTPMPHAAGAGPCPARKALIDSDGGSTLRVLPEIAAGGATTLLHLCVDEGTEAVRKWSVTATGDSGETVAVAVQPLGDRLAIATAPLTGDTATLDVLTDVATFQVALRLR
ncbi:hypothetical protein [Paractinoplanes atraurantiacus]|uniref:Uncharacterized protein n=1 Tax=Paractinoplanes atraurantiacus TaxID=1036182 RepID=A0A285J316_9ACTN|nr:hypothetical protein [Actinoplanes atraurantiacus]SNY54664.1 hypothetical protein SAMN05421748_115127 [Actinoplanes atraurantiacus]